jgi:predicted RNA polymerase sigma factor
MPIKEQAMARPEEERYTDLLRHLAAPSTIDAAGMVASLREVERQHSMGHITAAQLDAARDAYAATIEREPRQGPPRSPETRAEAR